MFKKCWFYYLLLCVLITIAGGWYFFSPQYTAYKCQVLAGGTLVFSHDYKDYVAFSQNDYLLKLTQISRKDISDNVIKAVYSVPKRSILKTYIFNNDKKELYPVDKYNIVIDTCLYYSEYSRFRIDIMKSLN